MNADVNDVFLARSEEGVVWGEWSDWGRCDNPEGGTQKRERNCLTKFSRKLTDADRCWQIYKYEDASGDVGFRLCPAKFRAFCEWWDRSIFRGAWGVNCGLNFEGKM